MVAAAAGVAATGAAGKRQAACMQDSAQGHRLGPHSKPLLSKGSITAAEVRQLTLPSCSSVFSSLRCPLMVRVPSFISTEMSSGLKPGASACRVKASLDSTTSCGWVIDVPVEGERTRSRRQGQEAGAVQAGSAVSTSVLALKRGSGCKLDQAGWLAGWQNVHSCCGWMQGRNSCCVIGRYARARTVEGIQAAALQACFRNLPAQRAAAVVSSQPRAAWLRC